MDINESNAPHTQEELTAVENIVQTIKMVTEGRLNDEQKQILRDAHADLRGENLNQPDWSGIDYLKIVVETVLSHGICIGKSRQIKITQKDFKEVLGKVK